MARHLGDLTPLEVSQLHSALIVGLKRLNCAGSVADDYSVYRALDREVAKAREALRLRPLTLDEEVRRWKRQRR